MDTEKFEALLQAYLQIVNTDALPTTVEQAEEYTAKLDYAAYEALEEAAALLGVSMAVKR